MAPRPGTSAQPFFATGLGGARRTLDELLALLRPPAWQADASCKEHPEVNFFPARGESAAPARAVCSGCLVRAECLAWALEYGQGSGAGGGHGVWAGTTARERRRLRDGVAADVARERARRREERRLQLDEQRQARDDRRRRIEDQRRALVEAWAEDPSRSVREMADALGASYGLAYNVRRAVEAAGELAPPAA